MRNLNTLPCSGLKSILLLSALSFPVLSGLSQSIPPKDMYLGQAPPAFTPVRLPLQVKNGCFAAERIAISNDGKDIYYSEIKAYYPLRGENIKKYSFSDGKWTGPYDLFVGYAPALSVTGDTMFFERKDSARNSMTFISVKKGSAWGNPKRILTGLDTAHYYQVTGNGSSYISTRPVTGVGLSDWCQVLINRGDTTVSSLGKPLNTSIENMDFFVSRDESFMVVANRPRLAISYKKSDGSWTNPRVFGPKVDFGLGSWGPYVTPDNKYMFYSTGTKPDYSDAGVYWVRIGSLIDSLKHTNLSPYVNSLINKQSAVTRQPFTFKIPDDTFIDEDNKVALTYSATLITGEPLPSWLKFTPETKTFSGLPENAGDITIRVKVTDSENAADYCPLKISVTENPVKK